MANERILVTGLWDNRTGKGPTFKANVSQQGMDRLREALEKYPEGCELTIWPVRERKSDKHPSHTLFLAEKWVKPEGGYQRRERIETYQGDVPEPRREPVPTATDDDSDLPFAWLLPLLAGVMSASVLC